MDTISPITDKVIGLWDRAVIQTCVIPLLRNTFRYASRRYWDQIAKDIRPIYTAPTEAAAKERFVEFTTRWGVQYPAITRALISATSGAQRDTGAFQDVQNGRSAQSQRGGHLSASHACEIALDDIRAQLGGYPAPLTGW